MYKHMKVTLTEKPPLKLNGKGERCIGDFQFRKVNYYYDVSPCVTTRTDASNVTYVIIRK